MGSAVCSRQGGGFVSRDDRAARRDGTGVFNGRFVARFKQRPHVRVVAVRSHGAETDAPGARACVPRGEQWIK